MKNLHFSIVNPDVGNDQTLHVTYDIPTNNIVLVCPNIVTIDKQQLGELGALFLALADKFDYDSIPELLDGYELEIPELLK